MEHPYQAPASPLTVRNPECGRSGKKPLQVRRGLEICAKIVQGGAKLYGKLGLIMTEPMGGVFWVHQITGEFLEVMIPQ